MKHAADLVRLGMVVVAIACARPEADTREPWYHASDVAQLAATGRPQLVEFFHPD